MVAIQMQLNMLRKLRNHYKIDKPLDELELKDITAIMNKVKFPCKLDISVFTN